MPIICKKILSKTKLFKGARGIGKEGGGKKLLTPRLWKGERVKTG